MRSSPLLMLHPRPVAFSDDLHRQLSRDSHVPDFHLAPAPCLANLSRRVRPRMIGVIATLSPQPSAENGNSLAVAAVVNVHRRHDPGEHVPGSHPVCVFSQGTIEQETSA